VQEVSQNQEKDVSNEIDDDEKEVVTQVIPGGIDKPDISEHSQPGKPSDDVKVCDWCKTNGYDR
jgi:hypothetical protein